MPESPHFTRRMLLVGGAFATALSLQGRNSAEVRNRDEQLSIIDPEFHFLIGHALDRLHDGHSLGLEFQLAVTAQPRGTPLKRALERFLVSYDLWEEKFSVARARQGSRPVSNLAAPAAELWCMDRVFLSTSEVPHQIPLWVRMDVRAEDISSLPPGSEGEPGFDLTALIDLFSRPGRDRQMRWSLEKGPVRLGELAKDESRR